MRRRELLGAGAAAALIALRPLDRLARRRLPVTVYRPGMDAGHWLRDHPNPPQPTAWRAIDTLIVGGGIGGLSAAWQLKRHGYNNFLLLQGPEAFGNAACGQEGDLQYPLGAHYLPIPTRESHHVREMLTEFGIMSGGVDAEQPTYDEAVVLHAPQERLHINGRWQSGMLPQLGIPASEQAQQQRFFSFTESLKTRYGRDGRKLFAIPTALSSSDLEWRALDQQTFAAWLDANGYTAPSLRWYLDYCCRDDYGAITAHVSAWAGLHYFASRTGLARNAEEDAPLTWPGGLNPLAQKLAAGAAGRTLPGFALHVQPVGGGWQVSYTSAPGAPVQGLQARHVVLATPLHVSAYLLPGIRELGFDPATHMPPHAPWLVSNFVLKGFPPESDDRNNPLAWDNAVYGGRGMGYVVATQQLIRVAKPDRTVFTAYQAMSAKNPAEARSWLLKASTDELLDEAACDLLAVYGSDFWRWPEHLHITLRGHAMASPAPGVLGNPGLQALREGGPGLYFAHSDLSGLSIFEEASWWGVQAANRILNT